MPGKTKSKQTKAQQLPVYGPLTKRATKRAERKRRRAARGPGPSTAIVPMSAVHRVCALTDPFCEGARGVVSHQDTRTPVLGFPVRGTQILNLASGSPASDSDKFAIAFSPGYQFDYAIGSYVGSSIAWPATAQSSDPNSLYSSVISEYRVVSAGVRIKYTGAPLYAQGKITCATLTQAILGSSTVVAASPLAYDSWKVFSTNEIMEHPISFVFNGDPTTSKLWVTPNANTALGNGSFDTFIICGDGLPTSPAAQLVLEWFVNIEAHLVKGSPLTPLVKPPPPANPVIQTAVDKVKSGSKSLFNSAGAAIENAFRGAASAALESASAAFGTAVGARFGGTMGARFGAGAGAYMGNRVADRVFAARLMDAPEVD